MQVCMRQPVSYKRHRFPHEVIAHAVWHYFRYPLSLRLVGELLLERGVVVSYETIRRWSKKFGPDYARRSRRKLPSRNDIWHLDEVVIGIAGKKHWLWRAVYQDGFVLRRGRSIAPHHQGCKASSDPIAAQTGHETEVDHNRQAAILWRGASASYAQCRASLPQRSEQPSRELPFATSKAKADHAALPISWSPAAIRFHLLSHQKPHRPASLKALRNRYSRSSPAGNGRVDGCNCVRLNSADQGFTASRKSYRDKTI
jgi:putative transposase